MDGDQRPPSNRKKFGKQTLQHAENKQLAAIKQQAEEQHRKKLLRRQIRKALEELYAQGEACEANQILSFIQTFSHETEFVYEVLVPFGYCWRIQK